MILGLVEDPGVGVAAGHPHGRCLLSCRTLLFGIRPRDGTQGLPQRLRRSRCLGTLRVGPSQPGTAVTPEERLGNTMVVCGIRPALSANPGIGNEAKPPEPTPYGP
jgi:hypothetical protein